MMLNFKKIISVLLVCSMISGNTLSNFAFGDIEEPILETLMPDTETTYYGGDSIAENQMESGPDGPSEINEESIDESKNENALDEYSPYEVIEEDDEIATESEIEEVSENEEKEEPEEEIYIEENGIQEATESEVEEGEKAQEQEEVPEYKIEELESEENVVNDATASEIKEISDIEEIENKDIKATVSDIKEENREATTSNIKEVNDIQESTKSEINLATGSVATPSMMLFGVPLFGATSTLGVDYGYWYTTNERGEENINYTNPSSYPIIHLTVDPENSVNHTSTRKKFTFGTDAQTNFKNGNSYKWYEIMTKVVVDDIFRPTTLKELFHFCNKLQTVENIEKIDCTDVTDTQYMFSACQALTGDDTGTFRWKATTSNVTNMSYMFHSCSNANFKKLVLDFDTKNVRDMSYMFCGCSNLETIDITSFESINTVQCNNMFSSCSKLTTIYATDKLNKFNSSSNIFSGDSSLIGGNGTKWSNTTSAYAKVDKPGQVGYFTDPQIFHKIEKKEFLSSDIVIHKDTNSGTVVDRAATN